jgi:hypothetical protein
MRFGKISLAAVAAASLVSAPVMAQSLSPAAKAVGANTQEESKLAAGTGVIIAVVAASAVVGAVVIASGNDDDAPTSP